MATKMFSIGEVSAEGGKRVESKVTYLTWLGTTVSSMRLPIP